MTSFIWFSKNCKKTFFFVFLWRNAYSGNSYKYKANTYSIACQWIRHLDAATKKHKGTKVREWFEGRR